MAKKTVFVQALFIFYIKLARDLIVFFFLKVEKRPHFHYLLFMKHDKTSKMNMQERVEIVGGNFEIRSKIGDSTQIRICI